MIGDLGADCDYTWEYFLHVRCFYRNAAKHNLATVFMWTSSSGRGEHGGKELIAG